MSRNRRTAAGWLVVAGQECRDLWLSGRGPLLLFVFSALLSTMTYVTSINKVLNFLEQREAVNLVLQVAVAVGALLSMVVAADGISGERERGTLESLLLTPVSGRAIVAGKAAAAVSLWLAAYLVSVPYLLVLSRGVGIAGPAAMAGVVVGTVVAGALTAIALLISSLSNSNKVSLAASIFLLLVLFAPAQLPSGRPQGWFFGVLRQLDPISSGLAYLSAVLVTGHRWTQDVSYLVSPVAITVLAGGALGLAGPRLVRLAAGGNGR